MFVYTYFHADGPFFCILNGVQQLRSTMKKRFTSIRVSPLFFFLYLVWRDLFIYMPSLSIALHLHVQVQLFVWCFAMFLGPCFLLSLSLSYAPYTPTPEKHRAPSKKKTTIVFNFFFVFEFLSLLLLFSFLFSHYGAHVRHSFSFIIHTAFADVPVRVFVSHLFMCAYSLVNFIEKQSCFLFFFVLVVPV